ncbi:MAG: ATP-binding protein [Desulfomonilaceae bacterium]|nr:ATP-binding protein [Desulfomonilaceae bacterium]
MRSKPDLPERVEFLESILENIPTGIIVADSEGKILLVNAWQERISRVRREQVLGTYFHDKWERLFKQGIMDEYWDLIANNRPFQTTVHDVYPQFYDERISAVSRGAPLPDGRGIVLLHDISPEMKQDKRDIRQLSRRLADSTNFLSNLIDSSPNIVITTGESDEIESANRTAEQTFGYGRSSFIGRHISFLFEEPTEFERYLSIAVGGQSVEVRCTKSNTEVFPAKMQVRDIVGQDGELQAKLFLLTDVTRERRMEEKLAVSEKLAIYSELMAGIAHQLNNPLVGVTNFAALLLERMDLDDPNRSLVETIHEAAQKCNHMLTSMTKSLREPKSTFHQTDLREVLDRAIKLAIAEETVGAANVIVNTSIHSKLPFIRGDSLQLLEVFRNIVVNALQAMTNGGTLSVSTSVDPSLSEVRVEISDTGTGIVAENLEKVFDPFFSTKKNTRGGLGLSFAYQVIKSHSGRINVKSGQGEGSVFEVTLPWSEKQETV